MPFSHTTRTSLLATMLVLSATVGGAQELENTITPPERPYPYQILDLMPGVTADEAIAHYQGRMDIEMVPEVMSISVQAPNGRTFAFDFPQRYMTAGVGINTRMGSQPYSEIQLDLATEVMGGRVVGITRQMRAPAGELPDAAALQAQLEELYGPPSQISTDAGYSMIYAWGEDGFISDLDAQEERVIEWDAGTAMRTHHYRLCADHADKSYNFQQFRKPIKPECVAVFRVSVSDRPPNRSVSFSLFDYDLLRQSHSETDDQIKEYLLGEAEASDFDL